MTTHLAPREMVDDDGKSLGLWRYTMNTGGNILAVGYCGSDPDHLGAPCPGHDTPQGALDHQKAYVLTLCRFDREDMLAQKKCATCQAWTSRYVRVLDAMPIYLCDAHHDLENLAPHVKVAYHTWET